MENCVPGTCAGDLDEPIERSCLCCGAAAFTARQILEANLGVGPGNRVCVRCGQVRNLLIAET